MQLSLKSLKGVRREQVPTSGWRIQAQILHFGGWRLLWINVYFPNDPRIVNFDEAELLVVQTQLKAVLERGGYDGCLCGGDWNYDDRRTSGFDRFMVVRFQTVIRKDYLREATLYPVKQELCHPCNAEKTE